MSTEQMNFAAMPAIFSAYQKKLMEIMQANTTAAFRYSSELAKCKTPAEFAQVTQEHIKQQSEAFQQDAKELLAIVQQGAKGD